LSALYLALEFALIDDVEIDQTNRSDTSSGQIQANWRTQPTSADNQHLGGLKFSLPVLSNLRQSDMPRVSHTILLGQLRQRRGCAAAGGSR
jgi:hypothetical protein